MKCPICNSDVTQSLVNGRLVRCVSCKLVFSSREELSPLELYKKDLVKTDHITSVRGDSRAVLFAQCLDIINDLINKKQAAADGRHLRLLDVGCGYGIFLNKAKLDGWHVEGVEVSRQALHYAKEYLKLKVFDQPLTQLSLEPEQYDVVAFLDVLYAVTDPIEEIAEAWRLLKPGGLVFARVGNVDFHLCAWKLSKLFNFAALGIKPYVFHYTNFNRMSLAKIIQTSRFKDINIINSPFTKGGPYGEGGIIGDLGEQIIKYAISGIGWMIARLTCGRCLISPSLIVWASKPIYSIAAIHQQ